MSPLLGPSCLYGLHHRRRIYTEDKAKIVASVWGTEFIELLAAQVFFAYDDFEE